MRRVAPVGLLVLIRSATQGLVALAGLRTLGFEKDRPAGACAAVKSSSQARQGIFLTSPPPHVATLATIWDKDRPCRASCYLCCSTQGLVALAGLRTLGFGTGRPAGACAAVKPSSQERLGDVLPPCLLPTGTAVKPSTKSGWGCTPPCFLPACRQGSKAPIGAIPPKPRGRSPAGATKPWVAEGIKKQRALQGRPS